MIHIEMYGTDEIVESVFPLQFIPVVSAQDRFIIAFSSQEDVNRMIFLGPIHIPDIGRKIGHLHVAADGISRNWCVFRESDNLQT